MAADDNVFHFQHFDSVLHHGQTVQVGVDYQIGHVAVNEEFAGFEPGQTFGRNPAVRTANPQEARFLCLGEPLKKAGIFFNQ